MMQIPFSFLAAGAKPGLPAGAAYHFDPTSFGADNTAWTNIGTAGGTATHSSGIWTRQNAALNGYNTARFNTLTAYRGVDPVTGFDGSESVTAYLVFKDYTGSATTRNALRIRQRHIGYPASSGGKLITVGIGGYSAFNSVTAASASTAWRVVAARFKGGTNNGRLVIPGVESTNGTVSASAPTLTETYLRLTGYEFAEAAFYQAEHSNAEMDANVAALKAKYGL